MLLDTSETYTGTPLFMAPEIINGGQYTKECDVYSLGSVVFMLCAGYAAYSTATTIEDLQVLCIHLLSPESLVLLAEEKFCLHQVLSMMQWYAHATCCLNACDDFSR